MNQCTLHGFFMRIFWYIDRLHGSRIDTGIVHTGGYRGRCWIEVLHLLWHIAQIPQIFCQCDGFLQGRTWMGRHQIWYQELVHAVGLVQLLIFCYKSLINGIFRFSHFLKYCIRDVLRCNFQLAADMILNKFTEKCVIRICNKIVKTNARSNKDFLYLWQCTELTQQLQIVRMIHAQILARLREQALLFHTDAFFQLLFTGWLPEVGRRASHIMDVSFKIFLFYELFCFTDQ